MADAFPPLDGFGRDYLTLALQVDRHVEGFVDAYIGPPELKAEVDAAEKKAPAALMGDLRRLEAQLPTLEPERRPHLEANLRSMTYLLGGLDEVPADYVEEVRQLFDVEPQLVSESEFLRTHEELDTILEGPGSVADRLQARRERNEITTERLMPLLELARDETRGRTRALYDLPDDEGVVLEIVTGKPWGAYNWYLGRGRSLIQFNTDLPKSALYLLPLFAHEGYPGHHTEGTIKDFKYYRGRGWSEAAAQLILSPDAVIAEGIAMTAVEIIFPDEEGFRWNAEVLLPAAGLLAEPPEQAAAIWRATRALEHIAGNAAFLFHTGQLSKAQTIDYLRTYEMVDERRANKTFEFITQPLSRAYIFTYTAGYELIARASRGGDKRPVFDRVLTEQLLPSELAAMAA